MLDYTECRVLIIWVSLSMAPSLAGAPQQPVASSATPRKQSIFDPRNTPSRGDWQRFHILTDSDRKELWMSQARENPGMRLQDWSWQWRLGWLRACGKNPTHSYCEGILRQGLQDPAAMVRAEAAMQFSQSRQRKNVRSEDIAALVASYERPDNQRDGKPLFVCERILDALYRLDTPQARSQAAQLAKRHPKTLSYWQGRSRPPKNTKKV